MGAGFDLTDEVAIMTGASRGIGEAIARTFAENGAALHMAPYASGFTTASLIVADGVNTA